MNGHNHKGGYTMSILDRDRTFDRDSGFECEGECRDRVMEGKEDRQQDINTSSVETPDSYPNAPGGKSRSEQPGVWGGHG